MVSIIPFSNVTVGDQPSSMVIFPVVDSATKIMPLAVLELLDGADEISGVRGYSYWDWAYSCRSPC